MFIITSSLLKLIIVFVLIFFKFFIKIDANAIIVVEDAKACFRRVLAGKCVSSIFVRRILDCERVEDCQQECANEKLFVCEGFNYRLDPSGHGKGDCELLDVPLSQLDIRRDIYAHPDYDYYERDRNAASHDCTNIGGKHYHQSLPQYPDRRLDNYYLPPNFQNHRIYEPYLPPNVNKQRDYWDFNKPTWGSYGGYYGSNGGGGGNGYNYEKPKHYLPPKDDHLLNHNYLPPRKYLPPTRATPPPPSPPSPPPSQHYPIQNYDYLKNECSLRSASGFRFDKTIIKQYHHVPDIYECELMCFKTKHSCNSYAFRYTPSIANLPNHNCHLSNKNYKQLDYYSDLLPDRDFDIYTMNKVDKCDQPQIPYRNKISDCFWRIRSGQRLHQRVVRDSLNVKTIIECQLECLHTTRFTCRAYSFRYSSTIHRGVIDNCQLTDCSYHELDPYFDLVPEPGFEVYERGSFGHGCETDRFLPKLPPTYNTNQLCYVGFGSPAKLLPEATRKTLRVLNELECKNECSKCRDRSLFHCMSFSFKSTISDNGPNCFLSDIMQRDLLPNIDYIPDPDYWLFAWDNNNPMCIEINQIDKHDTIISNNPLDTWRVYSVNGWPCKKDTFCKENSQAGFWYCELEGGSDTIDAWDYCCKPDHQCGYSNGFPYQWCYVGPEPTQWRKCSDRYYPYIYNTIDNSIGSNDYYLPPSIMQSHYRPDRPKDTTLSLLPPLQQQPSLDEYEMQFESQFLDPPKPGGFGLPRRWPVAYLHKQMPNNITNNNNSDKNLKYAAIQNLINIIRSNDLHDIDYQIRNNSSNTKDDVLYVKIPLPMDFNDTVIETNKTRSPKSLGLYPVYRKSYVIRTNITNYGQKSNIETPIK